MNRRDLLKGISAIAIPILPFSFFHIGTKRTPITVEGETPPELIQGIPGITYLNVRKHLSITKNKRAFFNGVDVSNRTCEHDEVAGWIRMYDVDENEEKLISRGTNGRGDTIQRIHFGKVVVVDK